jgi:hypothetical protein
MEQVKEFNIDLSIDDILRGEGADPTIVRARRPALVKVASDAMELGFSKIHPAAITHELEIIEHNHNRILIQGRKVLFSPLVARHLTGAERIVLVICTIGLELETYASLCMQENPSLGMALDGMGNAAIENIAQQVCVRIGKQARPLGLTVSTPISPGDPEWPAEIGQPFFFSFLDPSLIGIKLSSNGMMQPKKSVSFAVGVGLNMSQKGMCYLCNYAERCHYHNA